MYTDIRQMTDDDILPCARIMAETPLWQRYGVTLPRAQAHFGEALARERADLFVIVPQDDTPLGLVWCVQHGVFDRSGYIRLLMIDRAHRGRGLGARLLDYAEGLIAMESDDIFLLVSDFNEGAQRFYRRQGYRQVGTVPDYIADGLAELVFYKRLRPPAAKR